MVDPDSVIERAQAKLAELRQERQRLEDRRTKIEQDLARIAVAEATLAEMLGEKSRTVIPTAAGGSVTARTKARLDILHEILKSARHPMTPKDLMAALQERLDKYAGSRAALQDLLRRSSQFTNVEHGMWTLASNASTKIAAKPDPTPDSQQGEVDHGDTHF
jgi:acetylornithine deacetylase/succinyl-diaminopimelate desuccinylase-like protein